MKLTEVSTEKEQELFNRVHVIMNRENPDWVQPLDQEINNVFDPSKNRKFKTGKAIRWIATSESGELIGRIAAFVDPKYKNKGDKFTVGGIGFFECINDQEVANLLLDRAREWLEENGMQAMDGPINFGERNNWWGMITEGFQQPVFGMTYNPPYYKDLFDNYGFEVFYNQFCWKLDIENVSRQLPDRFYVSHAKFDPDPAYTVRCFEKKDWKKYAVDFRTIYNKAWASHEGNKEMTERVAAGIFKSLKAIIDPNIIYFTYHNDEPIALWFNIPDLNPLIRDFKGKLNWFNKLRLIMRLRRGKADKMIGLIYGIVPEFQGSGVDYFMIVEAEKVIKANTRYQSLELLWQGDFNPKMINISKNLTAKKCRNLVTCRYIFDRSIPFERHPSLI